MSLPASWLGTAAIWLSERLSGIRGVYVSASYPLFLIALTVFSVYFLFLLIRNLKSSKAFYIRLSAALSVLVLVFMGCHLSQNAKDTLLYTRYYEHEYIAFRVDGDITVIAATVSSNSLSSLERALEAEHITEIDTFVLTHYEDGIAEYLAEIQKRFAVGSLLLLPPTDASGGFQKEALFAAEYLGISVKTLSTSKIEAESLVRLGFSPFLILI
jgi:hypothetical protein